MMPTPVDNRSGNGHSRWRVAGRAQVLDKFMLSPPHRKFPHKLFGPIVLAAMLNSSRGKPIAEIAAIQSFQPSRSRQIPIAPAAPPQRHHRDFVPWRFSDAGSRASGWVIIPASEKPAQQATYAGRSRRRFSPPGNELFWLAVR